LVPIQTQKRAPPSRRAEENAGTGPRPLGSVLFRLGLALVITVLAGGVGAARMLRGLVQVVPAGSITAIVNTGDDTVLHGLQISPDIDTVSYTLAGRSDDQRGWGLAGETWTVMEALQELGGETWFRLGDRDLATHLYRTHRLTGGATLSEVTADIAARIGVPITVLPMSDDPVRTRLTLLDGTEVGFQQYFVALAHAVAVQAVRFDGAEQARPAPGVLQAITDAERVVISPSNPLVSIAPILAVPGIRDALVARRADVVAVSPLVGGAALKGPADRLMRELGHPANSAGIARFYADIAATVVIDATDSADAEAVASAGTRCVVAPTIMDTPQRAAALARVVLAKP